MRDGLYETGKPFFSNLLSRGGSLSFSPASNGSDDGSENRARHNSPSDPHRHLGQNGRVKVFRGERKRSEGGRHGVVVRSPTLAAISAHGQVHHDEHWDASRKGVREQSVPQGTPAKTGDKRRK
jgi:hypothetical protein